MGVGGSKGGDLVVEAFPSDEEMAYEKLRSLLEYRARIAGNETFVSLGITSATDDRIKFLWENLKDIVV